ncbi:MAG: hypothetical protein ACRELY_06165 [Polyangiaceae bacterium]
MQRPCVLTGVLLAALSLSVPAFAQKVADEPTPTAPAPSSTSPSPSSSADTNAASTTPDSEGPASGSVTAHPPRQLAPGEQAAIPQSDERRFVRSPEMKKMMERTTTWDLNVELGYGRVFRDPAKWEGFFRAGAGIMFVRDPLFEVLRFTYDYSPRSNATLGVELEADWVELGLWGQLGLMKDANSPYWGGRASLGFAIFGVEGEYRGDATTQKYFALYGKLRIPLGIIGRALQ